MEKKHLVFIVNPKSGTNRRKEIATAIENHLDKGKYSFEIKETQYSKHGKELAQEASKKGAYAIVAVGGDGSLNDIIAGLDGTNTAIAIIPKGSGNGMARTMQIPMNEAEAIRVINAGKTEMIDIGYANGQPFISNAGVAFDALISKKFSKSKTRGIWVYSWLVTRFMWTYKEWEWQITIDGKDKKTKAFIVNVANGRQFGYNFKIAPDASWTDGLFDVVIVKKFPKILGGTLVMRLLKGNFTKSPFVEHYRAKEVTVSHPNLKLMQTDGDAHACDNKVHFSIKHKAQMAIIP